MGALLCIHCHSTSSKELYMPASKSMEIIMGIKKKYDFFLNWVPYTANTYVSVRSLHYRARGLNIKFYSLVCFVIQKIAESPQVWLG